MKKIKRYVLEGTTPIQEPSLEKWRQWYATADRTVQHTEIPVTEQNRFRFKISEVDCTIKVTTVFLGVDHALLQERPLLYVTKITGGPYDQRQQWTSSWKEALLEHDFNVRAVQAGGFVCVLNNGQGANNTRG